MIMMTSFFLIMLNEWQIDSKLGKGVGSRHRRRSSLMQEKLGDTDFSHTSTKKNK